MRTLPLLAVCALASTAHADYAKAWTAAKANLPATTRAIAMLDFGALDRTPQFAQLWKLALASDREVGEIDRELKQLCKVDISRVAEGLVVAGDPEKNQFVFFLQLGLDRAKASACFEALMSKKAGEKVALEQQGVYSVFTSKNRQRSIYAAWPAPNVVAFTLEPENKPTLAAWIGRGGFARSPVAPLLARTDPKAIAAGALSLGRALDRNIPVMSGYGQIVMTGQNLTALIIGHASDGTTATKIGAELDKEIQREKSRKKLPPSIKNILASTRVGAVGNAVRLEITGTVKDLADAIQAETMKRDKPVEQPAPPPP